MFTASELVTMRSASEASMPDRFRVHVPGAVVDDGEGGRYETGGADAEYPCRKAPVGQGPAARLLADQIQAVGLEVIVLPWDAEVSVGMVGLYTAGETGAAASYKIEGIPEPTYRMERRVLASPLLPPVAGA
jgi:hypothetical protein